MLQYDGVSELAKAAPKRLADAWELLEQPTLNPDGSDASYRHLCAAQYLAGYAVECALKVYIISVVATMRDSRVRSWSSLLAWRKQQGERPSLDGSSSHNLELLLVASRLEPLMGNDKAIKGAWSLCCKWSPALRYRPLPLVGREQVRRTVQACEDVHRWVSSQMPG